MTITIREGENSLILTNDHLKEGDEVYPIGIGKCERDNYLTEMMNFTKLNSEPHIIKNLNYSNYKPYQIQTSHGFGPSEKYFRIIKGNINEINSISKKIW